MVSRGRLGRDGLGEEAGHLAATEECCLLKKEETLCRICVACVLGSQLTNALSFEAIGA